MDLIVSMAINVLLETVKDKKKAKQIQRAAFKVFRTIAETYGSEPEFRHWARLHFGFEEPK